MAGGPDDLIRRIEAFRDDNTSGASALTQEAIDIFFTARAAHADIEAIARLICAAQPSMASVWNAAAAARADDPDRLNRFAERFRRAPAALARFALTHFSTDADDRAAAHLSASQRRPAAPKLRSSEGGLHVVTLSYSSAVLAVLNALRNARSLAVSCSEARPALEGRRLALELAAAGVPVTLFGDNAIAHALDNASVVMVGADAIAPSWFLNKSGTQMLAAAAAQRGVPVYVIATREKFVGQAIADRLVVRSGNVSEIWDDVPAGIDVRNPYFESTPLDLVTAVISDVGILGTGMIPDVCEH